MNSNKIYSFRPFVRTHMTTANIMFITLLSLLPAAGYGMYIYGLQAALLMGISVAVAVASEALLSLILRRGWTVQDYSAVVTGLIGGMILPPRAPYYFAVVLPLVAIVSKEAFGGIGKNILNPAGLGKLVLLIAFRDLMLNFTGGEYGSVGALTTLAEGGEMTLGNMLLGHVAGPIGTGSAIMILIGALILFLVGITDIYIPIAYLGSFAIFWILFGGYGLSPYQLAVQFAGGSLLFTAFYMAQDNTTSPMSREGKIIYGVMLGLLTGILRRFGILENASLIALLVCNLPVRWLDTKTLPVSFGIDATVRKVRRNRRRRKVDPNAAANAGSGYLQFEENVVPKGAMDGSETAGTINSDSVESFRNRRAVTYDTASMDPAAVRRELQRQGQAMRQSMPVYGETVQQPVNTPPLQTVNPVPQQTMSFQAIPTFPNGQPMIDANGNPIPLLDMNGNPVLDDYGNMIWGQIPQFNPMPYMQQPVTPNITPMPSMPTFGTRPVPPVQTPATTAAPAEPVSRDTDVLEVAEIIKAAREKEQQGIASELKRLQYMDLNGETPATAQEPVAEPAPVEPAPVETASAEDAATTLEEAAPAETTAPEGEE